MDAAHRERMNPYHKGRTLPVGRLSWPTPKTRDLSIVDAQLEFGEREVLYQLPLLVGGGPIINLGDGGSATIFGLSLVDHKLEGVVHTVDFYMERYLQSHREHRRQLGVLDRVQLLHMRTEEARAQLAAVQAKLLFIDADHSYGACRQDFELYAPLVTFDGLVAFHDVNQDDVDRVLRDCLARSWDLVLFVNRIKVFQRRA